MRTGRTPSRFQSLFLSLVAGLTPLVIRLLARTWSFRVVNRRPFEEWVQRRGPVMGVLWHQMVIPGVTFFRDRGITVMVSRSLDGEMIARVARRLGFRTVRGSSSRGGSEALHELNGSLRRGGKAAITVDGPKGPAHDPKIGCVLAARATGSTILPAACRARPAVFAGSWDRTMIPLPFARIAVAFGEPFRVPEDASEEECEGYRTRIREAIDRAEEAAGRALGG
jgi:hypothetical protein